MFVNAIRVALGQVDVIYSNVNAKKCCPFSVSGTIVGLFVFVFFKGRGREGVFDCRLLSLEDRSSPKPTPRNRAELGRSRELVEKFDAQTNIWQLFPAHSGCSQGVFLPPPY